MKVYVVDKGAYENNHIDKVFLRRGDAERYVRDREAEAAINAEGQGYRGMDDCWDIEEYEVEQVEPAVLEGK